MRPVLDYAIGIGGSDQPDVYLQGFLASYPLEFTILNHPEEAFLQA